MFTSAAENLLPEAGAVNGPRYLFAAIQSMVASLLDLVHPSDRRRGGNLIITSLTEHRPERLPPATVFDENIAIRGGDSVILRTKDMYLPWGPLESWRECGHEQVCKTSFTNLGDAIHRSPIGAESQ